MKIAIVLAAVMFFAYTEAKPAHRNEIIGVAPQPSPDAKPVRTGRKPPKQQRHPYGGRYGPGPAACFDKKDVVYCEGIRDDGKCHKKRMAKRCKKTCGRCEDVTVPVCEDFGINCGMASPYTCEMFWFKSACMRSCNACPTEVVTTTTTEAPVTTTEPEEPEVEDCVDIMFNCHMANKYRCAVFWFKNGCKKSCGVCTPKMTTTTTTTTLSTTTEIIPPETTTESTTTTTTARMTSSSTTTTTEATTPTEPAPSQTTGTEEAKLCVDKDPKNCITWESLGLCYNEDFADDMKEACPLSCKVCQP